MKTLIVRQCRVGLVAGLAFFLGCARPSAEQPKAVNAPPAGPMPVTQYIAADGPPAAPAETPVIGERIRPVSAPANLSLSPGISEVVKLAQAGVGEEVIFAYVDKFGGSFQLGADQILYLKDLGVSENVLTTMLKHDAVAAPAASLVQTQIVSNVSQPLPVNPAPPAEAAPVAAATAPPPTAPEVAQFYDALSPYGSWVYLSTYGWCWQPTVAVSVSTWRPYADSGRWYWSDGGWYWNSDYSWGWAAFHYGRWYHHGGCGWVWAPGVTWGPSWVSWRYQAGYYGWAPLPPEAYYVSGVGFSYYGSHVGFGFEFGLGAFHYTFISAGHFCDYNPYHHYVPHHEAEHIYHNTSVANHYAVGKNNTMVNHGMGRENVARDSQTKIREVAVREAPVQNVGGIRGEHIEKKGDQTVVYRPQLPATPPKVSPASYANRTGAQSIAPTGVNRPTASGPARSPDGTHPTTVGRVPTSEGNVTVRPTVNPNTANAAQPQQNIRLQNNTGANAARSGQPVAQPQPNQPRAGNSLFGSPTANATVNTTPTPTPRNTVNPSSGQRVYTQPQTVVPQTAPRTQPNNNSGSMSPRQFESVARAPAPNYNAQVRAVPPATVPHQTAPPQSQPQPPAHNAPTGGGGQSVPRTVPSGGGGPSGGGNSGSQSPRGQ